MKRLGIVMLLMFAFGTSFGQGYADPRTYYREFSAAFRRIEMKNVRYLQTVLKGEDERRVARYAEMVTEQLEESKVELARMGPFEDDRVLYDEFMAGIDLYLKSFKESVPDSLKKGYEASFARYEAYMGAVMKAETMAVDASYKMDEALKYFASKYEVRTIPDTRTAAAQEKIDAIWGHNRDVSRAYIRVRAKVDRLLKVLDTGKISTMQKQVPELLTALRKAVPESMEEARELTNFDPDDLADLLMDYLEDIEDELEDTFAAMSAVLINEYANPDDYEDARDDLADTIEWHEELKADMQEEQAEFAIDYLED